MKITSSFSVPIMLFLAACCGLMHSVVYGCYYSKFKGVGSNKAPKVETYGKYLYVSSAGPWSSASTACTRLAPTGSFALAEVLTIEDFGYAVAAITAGTSTGINRYCWVNSYYNGSHYVWQPSGTGIAPSNVDWRWGIYIHPDKPYSSNPALTLAGGYPGLTDAYGNTNYNSAPCSLCMLTTQPAISSEDKFVVICPNTAVTWSQATYVCPASNKAYTFAEILTRTEYAYAVATVIRSACNVAWVSGRYNGSTWRWLQSSTALSTSITPWSSTFYPTASMPQGTLSTYRNLALYAHHSNRTTGLANFLDTQTMPCVLCMPWTS